MIAETLPDEKCLEMLGFHERCLAGASTTIRAPGLLIRLDEARV
jgi:hypothetical protein